MLVVWLWFWAAVGGHEQTCSIIIDRHNFKTGGTTMRNVFLANQETGWCLYWGYTIRTAPWRNLLRYLEVMPPSNRTLFRACIELHFPAGNFLRDFDRIVSIRRTLGARGCSLLLTTRVREPFAHYWSFFRWSVMGRQMRALVCERARMRQNESSEPWPDHCSRTPPSSPALEWRWGRNFTDWVARTPNLQSQILLYADSIWCQEDPPREGKVLPVCANWGQFGRADAQQLYEMLDNFDLVGDTGAFEAHLGALAARSGLPILVPEPSSPGPKYWPLWKAKMYGVVTLRDACPDVGECRKLVARSAPFDHELYRKYGGDAARKQAAALVGGDVELRRAEGAVRAAAEAQRALDAALNAWQGGRRRSPGACRHVSRLRAGLSTRAQVTQPRVCRMRRLGEPVTSSGGPSPCMPVPVPVATIWQQDVTNGSRKARFGESASDRPREMTQTLPSTSVLCNWPAFAKAHPGVVHAAGLGTTAAVCATLRSPAHSGTASTTAQARSFEELEDEARGICAAR